MNRESNRRWMVYHSRKNSDGVALCHLCNTHPGSQMHELVNRAQTRGNPRAQQASFHYTLCSWLCPECHAKAPMKHIEQLLWQYNYNLWGRDVVLSHLQVLTELLGHRPIVELPE